MIVVIKSGVWEFRACSDFATKNIHAGQYDLAIRQLNQTIELDPNKRGIHSLSFRSAVSFLPGFDWFVAPGQELRGGKDVLVELEEVVGIVLLLEFRQPPVVGRESSQLPR